MHAPNAGHCFAPRLTQKTDGSLAATKMDRKIALADARTEFQNRDPAPAFLFFTMKEKER